MTLPTCCYKHIGGLFVTLIFLGFIPFMGTTYHTVLALQILMFIALAGSFNLITGFTGYLSFGHVVYFGIGAYTGAILITRTGMDWVLASLCGGFVASAMALIIGAITLRLRTHYFSIATFGFSEVVRVSILLAEPLTKGGVGISLPPTQSVVTQYYAMAVIAVAVVMVTYVIVNSKLGLSLVAIREDEDAARVYGVPTIRLKVGMFLLSAFFPGVVGGVYAQYIGYINPEVVFLPLLSIQMIIFCLFGGKGTVLGPVIGAVSLFLIWELMWVNFPYAHLITFGVLLVVVVLYMPWGVVGVLSSKGFRAIELKIPHRQRLFRSSTQSVKALGASTP